MEPENKTDEVNNLEGEQGTLGEEKEYRKTGGWKKLFIFLIGFVVGITVKAQAVKTVTMGYEDYKAKRLESDFDLSTENPVPVEGEEEPSEEQQQNNPVQQEETSSDTVTAPVN